MIEHVVRLTGGLGNQLFQYALGRSIQLRTGAMVRYDLGFFEQGPGAHVQREFALSPFRLTCERANEQQISLAKHRGSRVRALLHGLHPRLAAERPMLDHPDMRFNPDVLRMDHDAYFDGYWQSERYFADVSGQLRGDLALRESPTGENARLTDVISGCDAVSVHVRRGDYVTHPISSGHHATCSPEYYAEAMRLLLDSSPDARFFVFSDDPEWSRANLRSTSPITFVDHNGIHSPHEDLRLMSLCRHHIIANSSLSWWGAWLNPSPTKRVIAPKQWFRDPAMDPPDLIPDTWTRI